MASKNIIYKVKSIPTLDLLNEYEEEGYFFRFQEPHQKLTSRSKSWGMIYATEREALANGDSILNGKSCYSDPKELINVADCYDKDYVIIVFYGKYIECGHDGEDVAQYRKLIDVFNYNDFTELFTDNEGYWNKEIYEEYKNRIVA